MKKTSIPSLILTMLVTALMFYAPSYATATDKVILKIEGMT